MTHSFCSWYHSCIVLTGLDENSVYARIQVWCQGTLRFAKAGVNILKLMMTLNI